MTILAGLICEDGIVVASDSQLTTGDGIKRPNPDKICAVEFKDDWALVAQAGNDGNSKRAIEIMRDLAIKESISDKRTVADIAAKALRTVLYEIKEQHPGCTMEQLDEFILKNELDCHLLIAHYFHEQRKPGTGKPFIYNMDMRIGIADRESRYYSVAGTGAVLGDYLLGEYSNQKMNANLGAVAVIKTVETVCLHDVYCKSPTLLAVIRPVHCFGPAIKESWSLVHGYAQTEVEALAKGIIAIEESQKDEREKRIQTLLHERWVQLIAELRKNPNAVIITCEEDKKLYPKNFIN